MRSNLFLIGVLCVALMAVGCGGGGGGGGGGGATTYEVSGNIVVPATASDTLTLSIRPAFNVAKLTAQAFDANGTSLSQGVTVTAVSGTTDPKGTFKLTVTPNSDVRIKVFNSSGFEFWYRLGNLAAVTTLPKDVDASSTARYWAYKLLGTETDEAAAPLATKLLDLLKSPSGINGTNSLGTALQATNEAVGLKDVKAAIDGIATALKAKDVDTAATYFDDAFTSSNASEKATVTKQGFKDVMNYRFANGKSPSGNRNPAYTDFTYSLAISKIVYNDANNAEVYVKGTVTGVYKNADGSTAQNGPVTLDNTIFFKKNSSNKWLVFMDFPYLTEQSKWKNFIQ